MAHQRIPAAAPQWYDMRPDMLMQPMRSDDRRGRAQALTPRAWGALAAAVVVAAGACAGERRAPGEPERTRPEATGSAAPAAPAPATAPLSAGCGAATDLPGMSEQQLTSGGRERRYVARLPVGYDGRAPLPLVIELHGSGGTPAGQLGTSQLSVLADAQRFAIVAPQALDGRWNVPPDPGKADDVRFIADLLDATERRLCVERRRVFATGFSGGGRMSSQLACDLSERVAAVAPVGGLRFPGPCERARSVPVIAFHGTADTVNPYDGGGQPYWGTSVEAAFDGWGRHNGCGLRQESQVAPAVARLAYDGNGCGEVVLYRIDGFDHSWPGAIYSGREGGSANDLIWAFLSERPLPAAD